MKKINWKIIAGGVAVVAVAGLIGGKVLTDRAAALNAAEPTPAVQTEPAPTVTPEPSFAVPTPLPSAEAAILSGEKDDGEPTITEDEDGTVTIVPDWEAKAAAAHPVSNAPDVNMSSSGGGSMDLKDGVYEGDHPKATPNPKPAATPAPTPTPAPKDPEPAPVETTTPAPTPTPTQEAASGGPPAADGSYNGEISGDGNYMWGVGFGWVEIGGGSYSIPGKGTHTEVGGEVVGEM